MRVEYYRLDRAAEILGEFTGNKYSADDLIYFGAWKINGAGLRIHILTAPFFVVPIHVNAQGGCDEYQPNPTYTAELMPECLREWDAGNVEVEPVIVRQPYIDIDPASINWDDPLSDFVLTGPQDGYWHYRLKRKNVLYPSIEELKDWQKRGVDIDVIYPEPIRLKECVMVVMVDDLERFAQKINPPMLVDQNEAQLLIDQESIDKKAVQDIGLQLLRKYDNHPIAMNCTQAKKVPEIKLFYEKYPGKDPVKVDQWLQEIGMPPGRPGGQTTAAKAFIPSLD